VNIRRAAAATLLGVLAVGTGISGCGRGLFLASSAASKPPPCTIQFNAPPSAVAILVHRDSASSRAALDAILLAASPDEYFFLFKAATGKLLGSFKTPPGPALQGPAPPASLPPDPTQVQTRTHDQQVAAYDAALRGDWTHLHLRWIAQLTVWASQVMRKAAAHRVRGPYLHSEVRGLIRGFAAAAASITSLEHVPTVHLSTRVILAILGLQQVPTTSPPQLLGGLQGVTVVVAGFTGTSGQETTWRTAFAGAGARGTVMLTPSTSEELPAVVKPVLDRDDLPSPYRPGENCQATRSGRLGIGRAIGRKIS
jgi:hypothetical protein